MAEDNTKFLRFSAYSIKDLITRKLSEDSKMTDQVYEGSNLAILIDIVSYMYQVLIQYLNSAAAESMFSDTQLYSNITRLVKFIGYNPKGCTPSALTAYITSKSSIRGKILPRYSYIKTGLTDRNGQDICFSTSKNEQGGGNKSMFANNSQAVQLYNGKWRLYSTIFTASGEDNETFVLDGIGSDSAEDQFIAHDFIDICVKHYQNEADKNSASTPSDDDIYVDASNRRYWWENDWELDTNGIFCGYTDTSFGTSLFNNRSAFKSLYPGTYHVYNVVLNENKQYELKFGNGVVGKKLSPGDRVYVFYLDTNGADGKIDCHDISNVKQLKFEHSAADFDLSQDIYEEMFGLKGNTDTLIDNWDGCSISFKSTMSTTPTAEETVEDIRNNAPMHFMTGNRLVTRTDYEYYLKNKHMTNLVGEDVIDVKCMNNWEYMASFYKWFYELGVNGKLVEYGKVTASPSRYLEKNNFIRYDYFYADSADANNIYIWLKTPDNGFDVAAVTANLNQQLNPIKLMTAEIVACKAINVNFAICAAPYEYILNTYFDDSYSENSVFDKTVESYIEITLDDNAICVPSSIVGEVRNAILQAFDVNKCQFGQLVKFDGILDSIYAINGITRVRTIFKYFDKDGTERTRTYDGLSFASWSETGGLIRYGDDLNVSNTMRQLEQFQYPVFNGKDVLTDRIKVIRKSLSNVNTIKF